MFVAYNLAKTDVRIFKEGFSIEDDAVNRGRRTSAQYHLPSIQPTDTFDLSNSLDQRTGKRLYSAYVSTSMRRPVLTKWLWCGWGSASINWKVSTDASVVRVIVDLDTCQLILVPEGTVGTRHREDVPLVGATGRLAHVELLAVVGVGRESGSALCEVVAQCTGTYLDIQKGILCLKPVSNRA